MTFVKLFDTPRGQLLAFLDDGDTEHFNIAVIGASVRGVQARANLGYDDEEARQRNFDKIDQARAADLAESLFQAADQFAPHEVAHG